MFFFFVKRSTNICHRRNRHFKIFYYFHLALGDIDDLGLFKDELHKFERTKCSINNSLAEIYPNVIAALKILLTTSAAVALAEPSFSNLKLLVGSAF